MRGIVISKEEHSFHCLVVIGVHHFFQRKAKINQFAKEEDGAIVKFHIPANKSHQFAALFKIYIGRFNERQTCKQIQQ